MTLINDLSSGTHYAVESWRSKHMELIDFYARKSKFLHVSF